MTGEELIAYIQHNHLEDYEFLVIGHNYYDTPYGITELNEDHDKKTVEIY